MEYSESAARWWHKSVSDRAHAVNAACDAIAQQHILRDEKLMRSLRAYGMRHQIGEAYIEHIYLPGRAMLGLNVVRSICDSIHAEQVTNRPRPLFLTGGDDMSGRWTLQRRARKLAQATEGLFDQCEVYPTTSDMSLDSLVFDGSCAIVHQPHPRKDDIAVDRVFPFEVYVDQHEQLYGRPATLYWRHWYDREELLDKYPGRRDAVNSGDRTTQGFGSPYGPSESDMVLVTEAWRLGPNGRHSIVTSSGELLTEKWEEDDFPFVWHRFAKLPVGFWGDSPAHMLTGIQYEINMLLKSMQEAHHLLGKAHVIWPEACGAVKPHWDNRVGTILKVTSLRDGTPSVLAPQVVSSELYRHLDRLYQFSYEIIGASQLGAQAKKPAGVDSGKALMVYEDATSKRFIVTGRSYEKLHIDIAKKLVGLSKRIHAKDPDYRVKWTGKRGSRSFMQTIPWGDVDIDDDSFTMKVFPTSHLSKDAAGRTAQVEQWVNAGWLSREEGMRLLEFPDVDAYTNIALASWDVITDDIEAILDSTEDDYDAPVPESYYDLKLCLKLSQGAYLCAKRDGAPYFVLKRMRAYVELAKREIKAAMQAELKEQAEMQGPPPGPPGPPGPPAPPPGAPPPDGMPMPPDPAMMPPQAA